MTALREECRTLGCAGDHQCSACAAKSGIGAVARLDPALAPYARPLVDAAAPFADFFGVPPSIQAAAKTAVGIFTPVSEQDLQAFAELVETLGKIQAMPGSASNPRVASAQRAFENFTTLWNAAQRDPEELRRQLQTAQSVLSALEKVQATKDRIHLGPLRARSWPKAAVLTAVGVGAVVVGGAVVLVTGKK